MNLRPLPGMRPWTGIFLLLAGSAAMAQSNLALNKTLTASSYTQAYTATNAADGNLNTYWEGASNAYPGTLTVDLGADAALTSVVVKLNPAWGSRSQTFSVLGKSASAAGYSTLKDSATYAFNGGTNSVTLPVSGTVRYLQLAFTANSGATNGQVAELEVWGSPVTISSAKGPFGGVNRSIANGSILQAEDFDLGGNGVGYADTTPGNTGGAYRNEDVDLEACGEGGYDLGWIANGEWWNYTVNATAGTYTITARVASGGGTVGDLQVSLDGVVLGVLPVNNTGGWQNYVDVNLPNVAIPGGTNKMLQLRAVNGGDFNINFVKFTSTQAATGPFGGVNRSIANGSIIQAEDYDLGGNGVGYADTTSGNSGSAYRTDDVDVEPCGDAGGGYNVGWIADGERLNYTVNATAGTYAITARVASASGSTGNLQVLLDGVLLGTIPVGGTGNWQSFMDATLSNITIPGGSNKVLQLKAVGGGFNLNYVKFASATTPQTYPLTVVNGSGSGSYAAGTSVAITAKAPAAGQTFAGWTGGTSANFANATSSTTTYRTGSAPESLTATYSATPNLGRGANLPYTRLEAEDASKGGAAVLRSSPNFDYSQTASEASNQKYIALPSNGSYVEWTASQPGQGVTMRFTMPDSADGMGVSGSLDCYVNGSKVQTINLSSYSSWQYFSSDQPQDAPASGLQAAFRFDETHWKLPTALKVGDTIRIQKNSGDGIEYGVDFIEVEPVPAAISQPSGSFSVTSYGAIPDDGQDDSNAFNAAVNAAAAVGGTVYIPTGTYHLGNMWVIGNVGNPIQKITITGAGMWHTNILFTNPNAASGGISFRMAQSGKLDFGNLYLNSRLRSRYGQQAVYKCFMDNFGTGSRIHDFWQEHFECGFWVADYAHNPAWPADGLVIENGRVRNNLADGINFCQGTKNSTVQNCSVRNNGDDGLAMWPDSTNNAPMEVNNTFTHNTIENNWRAAGIAIFGGSGHKVTSNVVKDCFMGSGFRINTVFPGYHFESNTGITVSDMSIIGCGTSRDCYNGERGAIDLEASNTAIKNITFSNIDILNTQRDAIQMGYGGGFAGIVFNAIKIDTTGLDNTTTSRFSAAHQGEAIYTYTSNGGATFNGLTTSNIEAPEKFLIMNGFNLSIQ